MFFCFFLRFWRNQEFFRKPNLFLVKKRPILERYEESYRIGCFLHQIGCFQQFAKILKVFFFEKPIFFSQEEAILSTFSEILLNQLHPTTNFLSLAVFKKVNLFQKIHIFYIKKTNFEHFEKFIHSVAMYNKFATFSNFSLKKVFVRNEPIYVFQSP